MTQAVPTNGFIVPPTGSGANIPPPNMTPGHVAPPPSLDAAPPTVTPPATTAAPAVPPTTPDLSAAIAALTAALGTQAPPANAEPASTNAGPAVDLNTYDVAQLGDPILQSMATVLQTVGKGIDLNRAIGNAIEHGDASLVDSAYLVEAGGDNAQQLITIAKGLVQAIEAKAAQVTTQVHTMAGGEAQWGACSAAFNTSAPAELKLVVKQMLDSNKPDLITAGAKIVVEFGKTSGHIPSPAPSVYNGAAGVPAAMALDKFEFQAELRKLDTSDRQFEAKRNELFARRQLGKQLGK